MAIIARCGRPDDGRANELFDDAIARGPGGGVLHVVRGRPRRESLIERASRNRGAVFDPPVFTFDDLVARLSSRRKEARRKLDSFARRLVIEDLVRREAKPPLRGVRGVDRRLSEFFSVLKQAGAFTRTGALKTFPSLQSGGDDVSAALDLLDAYGERLKREKLYDDDGLAFEVARDLGRDELPYDRLGPNRDRLVVDGMFRTTPVEREVLRRLSAAFIDTIFLLDVEDPDALDQPGAAVYAAASRAADAPPGEVEWLESLGATFERVAPPRPFAPARRLRAADDDAAMRAAADVAAKFRGDRPDATILVVAPSDRATAPGISAAFEDAGLPLRIGAARPLAGLPLVRSFVAALELPIEDFPREGLVAALRGAPGGFAYGPEHEGRKLLASSADRALRAAGVVGGRARYLPALEALAARCEATFVRAESVGDDAAAARARREHRRAVEAREGIAAFLGAFGSSVEAVDAETFVAGARALAESLGYFACAAPLPDRWDAAEARAVAFEARAAKGVADVLEAYRIAAAVASSGARTLAEHVATLVERFGETTAPEPPAPADAPRFFGLRDVRGLSADLVVVVGVVDGVEGGATSAPPYLDGRDAERAGSRTSETRRLEFEHAIYHAKAAARAASVWIEPARVDGVETAPSDALARLIPDVPIDPAPKPTFGRRALSAAVAAAFREGDLSGFSEAIEAFAAIGGDAELLRRRLRVETERRDPSRAGRHEGVLEAAARPTLAKVLGASQTVWSASRIEKYATCPLQYFFTYVLGVVEEPIPERDVAPFERGDVLHRVARRWFVEAPETAESEHDAAARLRRVAEEEVASRLGRSDHFTRAFLDGLLRGLDGSSERPGPLAAFFRRERAYAGPFLPRWHEATFGFPFRPDADVLSVVPAIIRCTTTGREFPLRGAVDRVDVGVVGEGPPEFVVYDYKTGRRDRLRKRFRSGLAFQIPLYAAALAPLVAKASGLPEVGSAGATYYGLRQDEVGPDAALLEPSVGAAARGPGDSKARSLLKDVSFKSVVEVATSRACDVVDSVAGGAFHPHRLTDADLDPCATCFFRSGCRGFGESERLAAANGPGLFDQRVSFIGGEDASDAEPSVESEEAS